MIYVAVIDVMALSNLELKIPNAAEKRIEKSPTAEEKRLRSAAYHALERLIKEFSSDLSCDEKNLELFYTDEGKPYLSCVQNDNNCLHNVPSIGISHDKRIAIAAISDCKRLGVDVQGEEISKRRIERIATRYLAPLRNLDSSSIPYHGDFNEEIKWFYLSGNGLSPLDEVISVERLSDEAASIDFLAKWTKLESVLKMSGGGFGDYPQADALLSEARTASFRFKVDKEEYVISIAI